MEEKEQTPPVQVPTEANNYKHIDTSSEGDTDDRDDKSVEGPGPKNAAVSGEESAGEILQKEKIIDPGNEHHHQADEISKNPSASSRQDADTGSNDTENTEPDSGKGKNDKPDISGEAG